MDIRKLAPGDRILDYRLLERLGEGGFGEVFRAEHEVLGRIVAIKVPRNQTGLTALRHEGVVQSKLDHPHIVKTLELSISNDPPYVVMDFVEGASLAEWLRREGKLPWRRAVRVLLETAGALAYAHGKGVIHGDVKPGNILVEPGRKGRVLLTDFGLGRVFEGPQGNLQISRSLELATSGAEVQGTLRYMSPELMRGESADERADIYSFGVLLFECLTGRLPEGREVPSDLVRDLPPELDRIFARTFTRRERRPANFTTIIEDLQALGESSGLLGGGKGKQARASSKSGPAVKSVSLTKGVPVSAPEPSTESKRLCKLPAPSPLPELVGGFAAWRQAMLSVVTERMTERVRDVRVGDGHGFDVCYGVNAEGEPHHRVYSLVLPKLDAGVARTVVQTARKIFEQEKGIWEKEVTFCVMAREVTDREQVLWAFKSFSMGWWRRRRMILQDLEQGRDYAVELGCDPQGNLLKRSYLAATKGAVEHVPFQEGALVTTTGARSCASRRAARGSAWGAALALVMAFGVLGSIMALELASRCAQIRAVRGQPVLVAAPDDDASPDADLEAAPLTTAVKIVPSATPRTVDEAASAPAVTPAETPAPAPQAVPLPPRAPDDFTPSEPPSKELWY